MSKFAGGYEPDPNQPKRIESLEWLFFDRIPSNRTNSLRKKVDSYSPRLKSRSIESINFSNNNNNNYKKYIFDSECYDYISKFKCFKTNDSVSSDFDDDQLKKKISHLKTKLYNEIENMSKYEKRSSMAADLLPELNTYEKNSNYIIVDPWKASRSRNASIEPSSRTRYQSPVNACKFNDY